MFSATPAWFADNVTPIAVVTLIVLSIVVVRMVQKVMTRTILLTLIAGVALFVYANNEALTACASTCNCRLVGQDVDVPLCDTELP